MPTTINGATGVSKVADDVITTASLDSTLESKIGILDLLSNRNKIINGNFDIWQRGTSQTSSGYGSVDRWNCENSGTTKTASRQSFTLGQTEVPGNPKYFMRHVVTSVANVANYCLIQQGVEDVSLLAGKTVTLSFWAKADAAKNIAIEFSQIFGTGGSPSTTINSIESQKITLSTIWTKYTITVSIPSISGKILGTAGDHCTRIYIWFDAGSSYNDRTANLGQQSGTFDIAQVQLEEGEIATPFEKRHIAEELMLCQRYYTKLGNADANSIVVAGYITGSGALYHTLVFPVVMRTTPSFFTNDTWAVQTVAQPTVNSMSNTTCTLYAQGLSVGQGWIATKALQYLSFDAEL